ncbi:hypothetical protein D3C77_478620 [compost metagenome]
MEEHKPLKKEIIAPATINRKTVLSKHLVLLRIGITINRTGGASPADSVQLARDKVPVTHPAEQAAAKVRRSRPRATIITPPATGGDKAEQGSVKAATTSLVSVVLMTIDKGTSGTIAAAGKAAAEAEGASSSRHGRKSITHRRKLSFVVR